MSKLVILSFHITLLFSRLRLNHGGGQRFWVHTGTNLGDSLISLEVFWVYYSDFMDPNTYCLWGCNNDLYVSNVTVMSNVMGLDSGNMVKNSLQRTSSKVAE